MSGNPEWRAAAFTGAGAILVALGIFIGAGWPFVLCGFVLLVIAAGSR